MVRGLTNNPYIELADQLINEIDKDTKYFNDLYRIVKHGDSYVGPKKNIYGIWI